MFAFIYFSVNNFFIIVIINFGCVKRTMSYINRKQS